MRYFPFEKLENKQTSSYKPSMGIKPLEIKNWLEFDDDFISQMNLKKEILKSHEDLVLQTPEIINDAIFETQDLLFEHLSKYHSEIYKFININKLKNNQTEDTFLKEGNPKNALKQLSLMIQEDFAFMAPQLPIQLAGGCICFPSRWNLKQKMNMNSDQIHEPVPQFKDTLSKPTQNFLEKISVEKPMWRLNWTVHDNPEIFTPFPQESHKNLNLENVLDNTFIRIERQTLRKLPKSQFVLFSIRTYVYPMKKALNTNENKNTLILNLKHLPTETRNYKGMKRFYEPLIEALEKYEL